MILIVGSDKYLKNESLELCNTIDDALKFPDSKKLDAIIMLHKLRNKNKGVFEFKTCTMPDSVFNMSVRNVYSGSVSDRDIRMYIDGGL